MGGQVGWPFLTPHARVLAAIARTPDARIRDIAFACQITERTAHTVVSDLERAGFLTRKRVGRRNHYVLHPERGRCHPAEVRLSVPALLVLLTG
ncbi:helix-turn-helix transcriptional regulator [Streptomyces glaucescens]|uniref:Putative regulatory protein n=1 Tax=Streptomyces glaucescens TaxID=1907 RepID=A0A089X321_STRGA|nr:helix-turn-helix domain-containing protein [Streptomyces glaucescens]AIR96171.1 putative regulatory protein [Streptomyces glaucescens]